MPDLFGLPENLFRFGTFALILFAMTVLEAFWPRRERRHPRARRWSTNFGILAADFGAVAAVTFVIPITAVLTALYAEANGWGLFNVVDIPFWLALVATLVIMDFVIWFQHWLTHRIPLLWRLHRVHHTDHDLDASTAVRFHPLEILFSIAFKSVAVLLLGAPAVAIVLSEAIVNGSAMFNHANLRIPPRVEKWLRLFVVTPDMHRIHHSVHGAETNSNYGFALSIWDRIFRTYVPEPRDGHDKMVLGLNDWQDDGPTRLGWSLFLPFRSSKR